MEISDNAQQVKDNTGMSISALFAVNGDLTGVEEGPTVLAIAKDLDQVHHHYIKKHHYHHHH